MALIKKVDVDNYFAERRAMRLGGIGPLSQPHAAGTEPAAKKKRIPASAEALTLEHSSTRVSPASTPLTSDSGRNRLLRPQGSRQE